MPINGQRRARPAKKYSASVCFLRAARRTAPTTSARLMTMITESRMPNTREALPSDSEFVVPPILDPSVQGLVAFIRSAGLAIWVIVASLETGRWPPT